MARPGFEPMISRSEVDCANHCKKCEELVSTVTNSNSSSCLNHETINLQTLHCCHKEVWLADGFLGPKERSF